MNVHVLQVNFWMVFEFKIWSVQSHQAVSCQGISVLWNDTHQDGYWNGHWKLDTEFLDMQTCDNKCEVE